MAPVAQRKPVALYALLFLLALQSVGALFGGGALIADPQGGVLSMPVSALAGSPFSDYLIPGCILGLLLGALPAVLVYALLKRPAWPWMDRLNVYRDRYWGWTYALYIGIMLVLWIDVQIWIIGYGSLLQTIYALLGVAIIIAALWPSVQQYYTTPQQRGA